MNNKNTSWIMPFAVLLTLATDSMLSFANAAMMPRTQDERKAQLVEVLRLTHRSPDATYGNDIDRLIEELAFDVTLDSTTARLLIRSVVNDQGRRCLTWHASSSRIGDAIATAGPSAIDEILTVLPTIDESTSTQDRIQHDCLLGGLSQMGTKGSPAIASLQRRLKDPKTPERVKAQLRIVLADLGYRPAKHLQAIHADFKDQVQLFDCVFVLLDGGQHSWVTDEMVATLADNLIPPFESKDERSFAIRIALVLGSLGRHAKSAAPPLEKLQRHLTEDRSDLGEALSVTLALSRTNPEKREAAFARLVSLNQRVPLDKILNDVDLHGGTGLEWVVAIGTVPALLMDANLAEFLANKLSVAKPPTPRLAAEILAGGGRYARHANPRLMALLLESDDPMRRRLAASVLGHTASFHDVSKLEKARDNEKVNDVRGEIAHAVKRIRTLKRLPPFLSPEEKERVLAEFRRIKDAGQRPKQKQP